MITGINTSEICENISNNQIKSILSTVNICDQILYH